METNNKKYDFSVMARRMTPPQIILTSFAVLILIGGLLLNLPFASRNGESIGFLDACFTSASAVCVTGLIVVNTLEHWSVFGKVVIITLIQLGGLGLMTVLAIIMVALRKQISLKYRLIIQATYNQDRLDGMVRLVKKVVMYTAIIELTGAVLLTVFFYLDGNMTFFQSVVKGVFHAISAFCNAGFDIIGSESLTPYRGNIGINIVIMSLITTGGIGFIVIEELVSLFKNSKKVSLKKRVSKLSLHSKLALTVTAVLIVSGAALFLLLEWTNPNTLSPLSFGEKLLASFFQSVTLRTAGFNTIDQGGLTEASKFVSCILMVIGGSSAGTAGGMKTVTLGVIIISMISVLKGRDRIEAFERTLPVSILQKALTVFCTMLIVVVVSTIVLCFTEKNGGYDYSFLDLMFECSSAAGTVGITAGITPFLSSAGKIAIILCMFLGRLGPVTVVIALNMKLHGTDNSTKFIEEDVIIG